MQPTHTNMASSFLYLLIFLLSTNFLSCATQRNPQTLTEIETLISFKINLNDPVGALNGWDSSTPSAPCDWRGVLCYNGRVRELRLPSLQLGGQLTDQLANLHELRKLSLHSNSLNGTIPSSLSKCTRLRSLLLQYNSFSGRLPSEISNLTDLQVLNVAQNFLSGGISDDLPRNLRYLDLSSNNLSGEIPRNFSAAPLIQFINLSFNRFSGAIPTSVGVLQEIQYLWLDWNLLEGTLPSTLANCSSLMHLSLQGNSIRGFIPSAIGSIPTLQVLSLSHNYLSGSVPSSMFCNVSLNPPSLRIVQLGFNAITNLVSPAKDTFFSVLQVLDLQENRINGVFPLWLTNVSTLTALDLSRNFFSGSVPIEIGNLLLLEELTLANNSMISDVPAEIQKCRLLRKLDLEGNQFFGEIPAFLGEIRGLKMLSLGGNLFSGPIPLSFGNLSELNILNLRQNNLIGKIPEELIRLSNLTILNLSGNKFSGEIPPNIGALRGLLILNLSGNVLSGRIPSSIGNLLSLTTLDLSRLNLSGKVPLEISGLPNLQTASLEENMLSGEIPEGFSSLLSLRYLNMSTNALSGKIPKTFGFLQSLLVLSLSGNEIIGQVPTELGNCSDLEVLQLSSNKLSGDIPRDLSRLSHLKELDLSRNNFASAIPKEISECSALTSLLLDGNHISGAIPDSLSNLSNLTMLDLSANNLTGSIPENLAQISGLHYFNVSQNNLEGNIPTMLGSRFNDPSMFAMNRDLCGKPLDGKCENERKGIFKNKMKLILLIGVMVFGACLVSFCCWCLIFSFLQWCKCLHGVEEVEKKRSPIHASSGVEGGVGRHSGDSGSPKLVMFDSKITYAETLEATRQFDEENVLSRGKYGMVFKACFQDGTVLSIRRLPDGMVEEGIFRKEAESLGKVKHRNITVLRGYYVGLPDVRLLVYDYMPNGNLATLLQEASHQDGHVLNWPMRHLIALGIARGLAFLHTDSMVHGDVKPQSVLFDADFEAHLSDFGLDHLTIATPSEASTSSTTIGTPGYVSPEMALTGEATKEADVYNFGIVLLELLTGRKPVTFTQDEDIVKWVKRQLQRGQVSELLEPGLLELDPESSEWEEFLLGVKVGLLCTANDPLDRPSMADVVFMLEGCRVGPDIPSSTDPTSQPSPA